ncbi:MAG TPA: flagellar basal body rod protein FlgC [Gammaproteobacteria bacterium]
MNLFKIFDISGSALSAQSVRLNTVASNLANADVPSATADGVYKARHPVFAAVLRAVGTETAGGVRVTGIVESERPPRVEYRPGHPLANEEGYVYLPAVNVVEEMADMISASRSYQSNVEVLDTIKQLMLRTLQLGQR